jgi:hypothetical protein
MRVLRGGSTYSHNLWLISVTDLTGKLFILGPETDGEPDVKANVFEVRTEKAVRPCRAKERVLMFLKAMWKVFDEI